MKIILNVQKSSSRYFLPNEAALYFKNEQTPTRILFEWFCSYDSQIRIITRMKRFIIRMKLYEQYLYYDKHLTNEVFL